MPKLFVFWFLVDVYVNNISLKKADATIYVYIYFMSGFAFGGGDSSVVRAPDS